MKNRTSGLRSLASKRAALLKPTCKYCQSVKCLRYPHIQIKCCSSCFKSLVGMDIIEALHELNLERYGHHSDEQRQFIVMVNRELRLRSHDDAQYLQMKLDDVPTMQQAAHLESVRKKHN